MATIHTTPRALAAMLAGLRLLQEKIATHGADELAPDILEILTDGGTHEPYTPAEIDALCEALNED